MRRASPLLVLATASVFGLNACSGDEPADSASSEEGKRYAVVTAVADPCALVTKAQADRALGAESTQDRPAEANIPPNLVTCRYTAPRGQGLAVMSVMVRTGYSESEARSGFQAIRDSGQTEPVSGLGDDAFWLADQLYVLKGTRSITVSGDVEKSTAQDLARNAIERLP